MGDVLVRWLYRRNIATAFRVDRHVHWRFRRRVVVRHENHISGKEILNEGIYSMTSDRGRIGFLGYH